MGNESGTWIMYGVEPDDPECIHTVDGAIEYINEVGFLPLFKNDIPGFSLEERTVAEHWWSENPEVDPWEWRAIIAKSGKVAYGKFFDGKAGFISKEWLPYFANYRRDGYDFDALWDDEKASRRQKKIMDLFAEDHADEELFSNEIKQNAGFGKDGEKGFDGTITDLQHLLYLCVRDFRQKKNKKGQEYGWAIAVYSTLEHIFGYDHVTSAYSENPLESGKKIVMHINDVYPIASADQIKKLIGRPVGVAPERKKVEKKKEDKKEKLGYPQNLFKDINVDIKSPTDDQILGLEFAIGQLKEADQEVIRLRYEQGLTYKAVSEQTRKSSTRCGQLAKRALIRLQSSNRIAWIIEGYQGHLNNLIVRSEEDRKQFIAEGKIEQADLMIKSPDVLVGVTSRHAMLLLNVGISSIGILREIMKGDFWTRSIPGIGDLSGKKMVCAMYRAGIIDENIEAYKETYDKDYYREKMLKLGEVVED